MKVGIIGTGTMGKPMAHHVLKAGYSLFIYARLPGNLNFLGSFVGFDFSAK